MDAIVRGVAMYAILFVLFRLAGKRTLAQITTFDFVLLLIISEATQQALLGEDFSITNAFLLITTLVGIDVALSLVKQRWASVERVLDDTPLLLVQDGQLLEDRMKKARVDRDDILSAARQVHGLERLEQIRHAVLEREGSISIIPRPSSS